MIYGRSGLEVKIVRIATLDDIKTLEKRNPDTQDFEALKSGSYMIVSFEDGSERVYHQAFLRADGGSKEISDKINSINI